MIGKVVRKFSAAGPCLEQGTIVRETAKQYVIVDKRCGGTTERRISKAAVSLTRGGTFHAEPCKSCTDHVETSYPHGYMD